MSPSMSHDQKMSGRSQAQSSALEPRFDSGYVSGSSPGPELVEDKTTRASQVQSGKSCPGRVESKVFLRQPREKPNSFLEVTPAITTMKTKTEAEIMSCRRPANATKALTASQSISKGTDIPLLEFPVIKPKLELPKEMQEPPQSEVYGTPTSFAEPFPPYYPCHLPWYLSVFSHNCRADSTFFGKWPDDSEEIGGEMEDDYEGIEAEDTTWSF